MTIFLVAASLQQGPLHVIPYSVCRAFLVTQTRVRPVAVLKRKGNKVAYESALI